MTQTVRHIPCECPDCTEAIADAATLTEEVERLTGVLEDIADGTTYDGQRAATEALATTRPAGTHQ